MSAPCTKDSRRPVWMASPAVLPIPQPRGHPDCPRVYTPNTFYRKKLSQLVLSTTTCLCGHIRTTTRVELINLKSRQRSRTTPIWLLSGNLFFKRKPGTVEGRESQTTSVAPIEESLLQKTSYCRNLNTGGRGKIDLRRSPSHARGAGNLIQEA